MYKWIITFCLSGLGLMPYAPADDVAPQLAAAPAEDEAVSDDEELDSEELDDEEDEEEDGVCEYDDEIDAAMDDEPALGALAVWQEVLDDAKQRFGAGNGFQDDEDASTAEDVARSVRRVMRAAKALRRAQLAYGEACFDFCDRATMRMDEDLERNRDRFRKMVDDCLMDDLRAALSCNMWAASSVYAVRLRKDGGVSRTDRVTLRTPYYNRSSHGPDDYHFVLAGEAEYQEQMVALYVEAIVYQYSEEGENSGVEPLSSARFDDYASSNDRASCNEQGKPMYAEDLEELGELFDAAETAWEHYCQALNDQICPSHAFWGTGAPEFGLNMLGRIRENHLQYLVFINSGAANDTPEENAGLPVACESGRYRYGELFTSYADLFRNPDLPGSPWCVIFHRDGPCTEDFLFYTVPPCEALEAYVKRHPEGGHVEVSGYMDVGSSGTPDKRHFSYRGDDDEDEGQDAQDRPAYTVRTVFRLLSIEDDSE